jgi:hypothetical protein
MMCNRLRQAANVAVAICLSVLSTGCGLLEHSLSPRTYDVNESADAVLNDSILLNIIRASYYEPLNFVAIAKYTAGGQLTSNMQGTALYAASVSHPQVTYGPLTGGVQASNSFDLNVLETKDFYNGLLKNLSATDMDFWFKQGLPRELVFYAILESIRVTRPGGTVYEYRNDPSDDKWTDEVTGAVEFNSPRCIPQLTGNGFQTNYDTNRELWSGVHARDCRFEKFRYLVSLSVKYGLRIESYTVPNPKWTKDSTTEPKTLTKSRTCYDPAIVRLFGGSVTAVPSLCGSTIKRKPIPFDLGGPGVLTAIDLTPRSAFAIFEYLGRVLASQSMDRVRLSGREAVEFGRIEDPRVLNVVTGETLGCFADAWYRGVHYCVPNEGSENTKRIFTLLRAVLATNLAATDLNATPTVRVTP